MGNKPPVAPKKTDAEIQREMTRMIDRQIRDFDSEKRKIDFQIKKSTKDLKTLIDKKEPKASQRILAAQILRSRKYMEKYSNLEGQMKALKIQLASTTSTQTMVGIMQKMGQILGKTTSGLNVANVQQVIEQFTIQQEKQAGLNELMEDALDVDTEGDADEEIDDFIDQMAGSGPKGGHVVKQTSQETSGNNLDDLIKDLKK